MKEWGFAQTLVEDRLAQLHLFSIQKRHSRGEIEFIITVREYVKPKEPEMLFFAQADKQTNQKVAPYTPSGWGRTLLDALSECINAIHRFPYEGPEAG